MTIKDAIYLFKSKNPDKKLRGYWATKNSVIICIKPQTLGVAEVNLFEIKPDGKIMPTNPIMSPIVLKEQMTKL